MTCKNNTTLVITRFSFCGSLSRRPYVKSKRKKNQAKAVDHKTIFFLEVINKNIYIPLQADIKKYPLSVTPLKSKCTTGLV